MQINIQLPKCNLEVSTYKQLQGYLKQLELAVHHAQKAVENAEESDEKITENCCIFFDYPKLDDEIVDMNYDELQRPELSIDIQ